ncbi:LAMI_0A01222g1_1 [Lachancea mirantina]|uniref:LAMI_0A01222g1_1 n=1 Tax=Lachancea mirantina TaxID=1230905 RepID=A0A1G4ILP7_9SACH|nr:LAMI_0A01222g1_1 [Lachancea mirantina]
MLFLSATANLSDNIRSFRPLDTVESPSEYTFNLMCTHCREMHDSKVTINQFEKHSMSGSRGEASFVVKCKFCGNESSINLQRTEEDLYNFNHESTGDLVQKTKELRKKQGIKGIKEDQALLLALDCRGCEPTALDVSNLTFVIELTSGKTMECTLDDEDLEWYDYDEDAGEEVSVTEAKFGFIKAK